MDRSEERLLWDRILGLLEQDLDRRRNARLFVEEVPGESGSYHEKEIGEPSASERQDLHPGLKEYVAERLLHRYLAEQGYVDLVERRRPYYNSVRDLTPADLPALVEADRQRSEEEHRKERERAEFDREARAGLERLRVVELAQL